MASTASTPHPVFFNAKQTNDYLANLRHNRVARPNGSRPPPASTSCKPTSQDGSNGRRSSSSGSNNEISRSGASSVLSYYRGTGSVSSGRASPEKMFIPPQRTSEERQQEKEEAHAMRLALEQAEIVGEQGVHLAAQKEAAELVWKHEHPHAPFRVQPGREINLHEGIVPESPAVDAEEQTIGLTPDLAVPEHASSQLPAQGLPNQPSRSPSKRLRESISISKLGNRRRSSATLRNVSGTLRKAIFPNAEEKIWEDEPKSQEQSHKDVTEQAVPSHVRRNPFARVQSMRQGQQQSSDKPQPLHKTEIQKNPPTQSKDPSYMHSGVEPPRVSSCEDLHEVKDEPETADIKYKDGIEVRGDDIRAATSMKMKDRSPRLPSPTVVSGSPGRPIVSFNHDWQPSEKDQRAGAKPISAAGARPGPLPFSGLSSLQTTASAPVVPTINHPSVPNSIGSASERAPRPIPQICLPDEDEEAMEIPSITVDDSSSANVPTPSISISEVPHLSASTPTPTPSTRHATQPSNNNKIVPSRPQPRHADTAPLQSTIRPHWSPAVARNAALCAQCALPIGGRIVTAAGTRFHPHCFTCHHCGEGLECVAFYAEPAAKREARLERMERRLVGEEVEPPEGQTLAEDSDDALRFYCHLDFHEFFSPRCKSCKTPIEGEVIVACGAEWHVGHFFCAQCGDPFDPSTPFVEKEGYAWCVGCHTNRTSAKCKKCRKPVTDMVLKALGAEWHDGCFRCLECDGRFEDGRYFLRGDSQDPVCSGCEERRLKA